MDDAEFGDDRAGWPRCARLVLGREAGDQVGADGEIGPARACSALDQVHRIAAQMAALHPLEDQVMRRAAATGAGAASPAVRRRAVRTAADRSRSRRPRTGAGAAGAGNASRMAATRCAKPRRAGQVMAPTGQVDAGQHHFACARRQDGAPPRCKTAAIVSERLAPAPLRDHAEGAGVIAAVLHRDKGAGARADTGRRWSGATFQARGSSLAALAINPSTSGIAAERIALDFGRAAGHQQPRVGAARGARGGSPGGSGARPRP